MLPALYYRVYSHITHHQLHEKVPFGPLAQQEEKAKHNLHLPSPKWTNKHTGTRVHKLSMFATQIALRGDPNDPLVVTWLDLSLILSLYLSFFEGAALGAVDSNWKLFNAAGEGSESRRPTRLRKLLCHARPGQEKPNPNNQRQGRGGRLRSNLCSLFFNK